jgi:hypothetical protein
MAKVSSLKHAFIFLRDSLRESLFRNVGMSYRNLIGLLLGATASLLPMTTGSLAPGRVAWIFLAALLGTIALLVIVRPNNLNEHTKPVDQFAWGLLVILIFGFGLGALVYQARPWWNWLWRQYLKINEPHELVLEFLFILGVILGVFIVRNWGKEQKAFTESLTGVLGGTFVAAIFGESLKEQGLTPMRALTYYGLGFVISAAINLLIAGLLTAKYTNTRSKASRAMLDFLYGSERAKAIDGYFLQNFKEDQDYAKQLLTRALLQYRELVRREFAKRMEARRLRRSVARKGAYQKTPDQSAECREFWRKQQEEIRLRNDLAASSGKDLQAESEMKDRLEKLHERIEQLKREMGPPSYYYQLIAICCDPKDKAPQGAGYKVVNPADQDYEVIYKQLEPISRDNDSPTEAADESITGRPQYSVDWDTTAPFHGAKTQNTDFGVTSDMFRVGVLQRQEDDLHYIVAPGPYRAPFRYFGSVAGLSLLVRQTIIMNRDKAKRFRAKDYRDGICPRDIEQWRGLDEIDYLSYISIPVFTNLGSPGETGIGVINIDTKLFVTHCKLEGEPVNLKEGIFRTRLTPGQLTQLAVNLYEENDQDVAYVEQLTEMIVPIMELYSRCQVGAI